MKKVAAIAGGVVLAPMLLIAPITVALAGASNAQAACGDAGGAGAVDAKAVAEQVQSILKGGGKGSVSVAGLDNPKEQIPNAKTILATGVAMKVPPRGQIVALATALQESGLRNLDYGDRDSLGLFQQRPSQGWGTAAQVRDPVHASTKFYEGLLKVSGWQSMTIAQAAQAVQASGFPDAYAKWEGPDQRLPRRRGRPAQRRQDRPHHSPHLQRLRRGLAYDRGPGNHRGHHGNRRRLTAHTTPAGCRR